MDSLEGILLVPPERGQILGRAVWKNRYIVVGRRVAANKEQASSPNYSQLLNTSRNHIGGGNNSNWSSKSLVRSPNDDYSISMYKSKDDQEPIHQWPITTVSDCQVQNVAHRKQGPVLPTLIITISDKERKRRSSRAAGFISSNKESAVNTLWFRTSADDHRLSLNEWAQFIMSKKGLASPDSPGHPLLTNPFAPRPRDASDYFPRPGSSNQNNRSLHHKSSTATYSTGTRDRPLTFSSESVSLKSKRSDVSTPSSCNYPLQHAQFPIPGQHYTTVLPSDIPNSPTLAAGEPQRHYADGWTATQGRSSTMSSPVQGRESLSSHAQQHAPTATASSPPAPRETILDRAFQLKFIPGAEHEVPGEEKLSSLARFDALMREADERRIQRQVANKTERLAIRSAFEADGSTDDEDEDDEDQDDDSDADNYVHEQDPREAPSLIPPTTKRALDFIADRSEPPSPTSPRPSISRTTLSYHADMSPNMAFLPPTRPHTAHPKNNQLPSSRYQSHPNLVHNPPAGVASDMLPSRISEDTIRRPGLEKRQSTSSAKRLSFTEFTKRLSSTSSLLLVQTNSSGGTTTPITACAGSG